MRASLEQLKAMSDEQLWGHWSHGLFPFDVPIGCSRCLTFHGRKSIKVECHTQLVSELLKLEPEGFFLEGSGAKLREHLEALYALRLFYDSLYPPSDETPSLPVAVAADVIGAELVQKDAN